MSIKGSNRKYNDIEETFGERVNPDIWERQQALAREQRRNAAQRKLQEIINPSRQ